MVSSLSVGQLDGQFFGVDHSELGDRAGEHDVEPAQPCAAVRLGGSDGSWLDDDDSVELQPLGHCRRDDINLMLHVAMVRADVVNRIQKSLWFLANLAMAAFFVAARASGGPAARRAASEETYAASSSSGTRWLAR